MEKDQNKALSFFYAASFTALCLALLPWLGAQWSQAINTDTAYLTLAAGRMLDGLKMSEAYYDTNLPLSIIVHLPAAALSRFTAIPLYYATNIYALVLLTLSTVAIAKLLGYFKELSPEQRLTILGAYLLTNTIHTGFDFGQKDQLIGLALFPLALTQILITQKINIPAPLKTSVLAAGSFFILIKPHYGLIPAAIFIHRAITKRRLISIIKDVDFVWLAGMAIGYLAVLFVFFSDFLTIILPDILKYYASDISLRVILGSIVFILQALIPFFLAEIFLKKAPKLLSALSLISALCFIPFMMQGKGWLYHALPADMFLYSAYILTLSYSITAGINTLSKASPRHNLTRLSSFALPMILFFALIARDYAAPPTFHRITHKEYKNTKFAKRIEDCKQEYGQECSFLMPSNLLNISKELSVYTGAEHATRFSHVWFVPTILNAQSALRENHHSPLTQTELKTAIDKYAILMAKDFDFYDPKLIFITYDINLGAFNNSFDLKNFTLTNAPELFAPIWDRYELEESVMIDRLDYMPAKLPGEELVRYDIYRKKKNIEESKEQH